MSSPIYPRGTSKVHEAIKTSERGDYSRRLDSMKMLAGSAVGDILADNIPNYRAVLQAGKSFKNEESRRPTNRSAGKADVSAARAVFQNKGFTTLLASRLKRTAPF